MDAISIGVADCDMKVSEQFNLDKSQAELDFVDVELAGDTRLYIDPFAISQRPDAWCRKSHLLVEEFFQEVVNAIRAKDISRARELLSHLGEPNETRLGESSGEPRGRGMGIEQAEELLEALTQSSAVQTGFLSHLEDSELMVPGIGRDKISDLCTNVLRRQLVEYTQSQCGLHGIPLQKDVALEPYYDEQLKEWVSDFFDVPVVAGKPLLLVPKAVVRRDPAYRHDEYFSQYILTFLQAEHLSANTSLVRTFKKGKVRKVFKKDLVEFVLPKTKENIFEFSRAHPEVLAKYRAHLADLEKNRAAQQINRDDEVLLAGALVTALTSIPTGNANATAYHHLMIGIVEFLFYPNILYPRKELEIHDGRKRIDIVAENSAMSGVFHRLHAIRGLPCPYIMIECKNYEREIANPELDQLAGRFSPNRGKVGIMLCRKFEDRPWFVARCRDTLADDRGLVIALSDAEVVKLLATIEHQGRDALDQLLSEFVTEVYMS